MINLYVLFGTFKTQENQFQSIPPYFMGLVDTLLDYIFLSVKIIRDVLFEYHRAVIPFC